MPSNGGIPRKGAEISMNVIFRRNALCGTFAIALLSGCGSGMSPTQSREISPGTPAQSRAFGGPSVDRLALTIKADRHGSWMAPDAKKTKNLLYVADQSANDVLVYSYPAGKLKGTLTGFETPTGICSGKNGDVVILNGNGTTAVVYAHGGSSPLRTLDLPGYPELNCSIDPKTGNLALGVLAGSCGDCVAVFSKAQGIPTTYMPSNQNGVPGCGYDNSGNLYCDAYGSGGAFALYELSSGGSSFKSISVSGANGLTAASIQWDGTDLAFASGAGSTLYQIKLSGSSGSIAGSTALTGAGSVWQFWITKNLGNKKHKGIRVIAPTYGGSAGSVAGYWNYPAGGDPTQTITGFSQPDGAALSTKK